MKIIEKVLITSNSSLIYAKVLLKNLSKDFRIKDFDFLEIAIMEIGTNILKHAKNGEIWFIDESGYIAIVGLDKGKGIKDINWALENETSSLKDSLGIGLYTLKSNLNYFFEIFSIYEDFLLESGTIVGLFNFLNTQIYLNDAFYKEMSGDFLVKKDNFFFFGDVSGHGIKAYKSATKIKEFFLKSEISCDKIDSFFKKLDLFIKKNNLRSLVGVVFKEDKNFDFCGVGNIYLFANKKLISFENGVIGEIFYKSKKISIKKGDIILISDGIDLKSFIKLLKYKVSFNLLPFCAVWFCGIRDDKSIFLRRENV